MADPFFDSQRHATIIKINIYCAFILGIIVAICINIPNYFRKLVNAALKNPVN